MRPTSPPARCPTLPPQINPALLLSNNLVLVQAVANIAAQIAGAILSAGAGGYEGRLEWPLVCRAGRAGLLGVPLGASKAPMHARPMQCANSSGAPMHEPAPPTPPHVVTPSPPTLPRPALPCPGLLYATIPDSSMSTLASNQLSPGVGVGNALVSGAKDRNPMGQGGLGAKAAVRSRQPPRRDVLMHR